MAADDCEEPSAEQRAPGERPAVEAIATAWAAELPGVDTTSLQLVVALRRLSQNLERDFLAICRRHDVGPSDARILLVLRRSPPDYALSPSDLYRELLITSGAVTKQIDRLVSAGLVVKTADPAVLRGLLIVLQPDGRRLAEQIISEIGSYPWLRRLSRQQKQQTVQLLLTIDAAVDSEQSGAAQ